MVIKIKKILVPLDGSKYSHKAILQACDLAKNYQAQIILLYVVEKGISINLLDRKAYLEMLRKVGNNVLVTGKKNVTKQGMDSKIVIKEGNIANEIIKLAKKEQCNLIVMGNKGLGATARFLLGSISNKLVNNWTCSILIVK